jgi:inner membrane protein
MDSLTQLTLGAAVGEATLGKQVGRKAPLWGAAFGTLPDLDVLANPFLTEVQALAFHRSMTHSFLFVLVAAPLLGWFLRRLHPSDDVPWRQWTGLAFACLLTHVLLDCLTTYGTQVFWPFSDVPVIFGTIFIIDPLYTVPLATGLLAGLWWGPTARPRRLANGLGLALSSLYLLATIGNKLWVEHVFETSLQEQNLPHQEVFTKPTAFNNILWSGIAKAEDGFYIGFYSLLDDDTHVDVRFVPANHHLLKGAWTNPTVQELRRFSRGYFTVSRQPDGSLAVHDLRFGRSDLGLTKTGRYIFTFRLTRGPNGAVTGFTRTDPQIDARSDLIHRFVQRVRGNESAVRPSS